MLKLRSHNGSRIYRRANPSLLSISVTLFQFDIHTGYNGSKTTVNNSSTKSASTTLIRSHAVFYLFNSLCYGRWRLAKGRGKDDMLFAIDIKLAEEAPECSANWFQANATPPKDVFEMSLTEGRWCACVSFGQNAWQHYLNRTMKTKTDLPQRTPPRAPNLAVLTTKPTRGQWSRPLTPYQTRQLSHQAKQFKQAKPKC